MVKKMNVAILMKVVGVGLLVSVANQILSKSGRDEQAMLVSIAGVVIVLLMLLNEITALFENIRGAFGI